MPQSPISKSSDASSKAPARRTSLGVVSYCFDQARKARGVVAGVPDFSEPLSFIKSSWEVGAGAVQIAFGTLPAEMVRQIRDFAGEHGVYLEATVSCPRTEAQVGRFEAELKTLNELGVKIARAVIFAGRRYEQFKSMRDFREAELAGKQALKNALPIAQKHGIRLALENHKDQRTDERLKLFEEFGSEWLGACLDVGNNLALLEDPVEVAEAFAPWTLTVHFKDQAIQEYAEGFLLADIPLGRGCIDLRRIVAIVREKKPKARFQLELITRDALKVPTLRPDYWETLSAVKASEFAAHQKRLKTFSAKEAFPMISKMDLAQSVAAERQNVEESFRYAAEQLGFSL